MLVQNATIPGFTIGINGLAGNLGIAVAAILTGFLIKHFGWRVAFTCRALVSIAAASSSRCSSRARTSPPREAHGATEPTAARVTGARRSWS